MGRPVEAHVLKIELRHSFTRGRKHYVARQTFVACPDTLRLRMHAM